MASASTPQAKDVVLANTVQLKPMIKLIASIYLDETRLKKLIMIIVIIMKKSQDARNDCFWWAPEIDFLYETKVRK